MADQDIQDRPRWAYDLPEEHSTLRQRKIAFGIGCWLAGLFTGVFVVGIFLTAI